MFVLLSFECLHCAWSACDIDSCGIAKTGNAFHSQLLNSAAFLALDALVGLSEARGLTGSDFERRQQIDDIKNLLIRYRILGIDMSGWLLIVTNRIIST